MKINEIESVNQEEGIQRCITDCKMIANLQKTGLRKGVMSPAMLLLKYGKPCYMNENSFDGPRHKVKACFMNAYKMATSDHSLIYVEGKTDIGPLVIEHAWVITKDGSVIDPTLTLESKSGIYPRGYFGIPFKTDYIMKVALRSGVYGVLDVMSNRPLIMGQDKPKDFLYAS